MAGRKAAQSTLKLSPVLDLYNSEIIAWQMATHQGMRLVDKMLDEALASAHSHRPLRQHWHHPP